MTGSTPSPTPRKPRPPSPYQSVSCADNLEEMCAALIKYGKELEEWGNDVLGELDDLKAGTGGSGGSGGPPQDATQPPPPPFKK